MNTFWKVYVYVCYALIYSFMGVCGLTALHATYKGEYGVALIFVIGITGIWFGLFRLVRESYRNILNEK